MKKIPHRSKVPQKIKKRSLRYHRWKVEQAFAEYYKDAIF
jgi:hypothetical protein